MGKRARRSADSLAVLVGHSHDLAAIDAALAEFNLPRGPTPIDSLAVARLIELVDGCDQAALRLWLISRQNEHWSGRSRRPKLAPSDAPRECEPPAKTVAPLLAGLRLVTAN